MKTSLVISILFFVFMVSCKYSEKELYAVFEKATVTSSNQEHPGKKLMEINCYVCHNPTASMQDRIGPPMIAIKKHYVSDEITKEEFIKDIQNWIKYPNQGDSKMPGAVKRFGVMPNLPFPEETIMQIADYLFDNKIEQPKWFESHFEGEQDMKKGHGMK